MGGIGAVHVHVGKPLGEIFERLPLTNEAISKCTEMTSGFSLRTSRKNRRWGRAPSRFFDEVVEEKTPSDVLLLMASLLINA